MGGKNLTAFDAHESLHTASVLLEAWNEHVRDTAYVNGNPRIACLVDEAAHAMHMAYDAICRKSIEDYPDL